MKTLSEFGDRYRALGPDKQSEIVLRQEKAMHGSTSVWLVLTNRRVCLVRRFDPTILHGLLPFLLKQDYRLLKVLYDIPLEDFASAGVFSNGRRLTLRLGSSDERFGVTCGTSGREWADAWISAIRQAKFEAGGGDIENTDF